VADPGGQSTRHDPGAGLVLASASPRRRELLGILTDAFSVEAADLDESLRPGESADDYTIRLARDKARAVSARGRAGFVLGADTTVVVDGRCLGKPTDPADAGRMLRAVAGRWHEVYSAVALGGLEDAAGRPAHALSVTRVRFAKPGEDWIERYVESGEPMDKAGGYAIQGAAAAWIPEIQGSYSAVMGLPLFETAELLRRAALI